jgi:DNA (cytosine-5)-methyltransferase 1
MILHKVQPAIVLLENVEPYSQSASAMILRHQLRDMGYRVHEAVLEGKDFGCLENRTRWVLVAVTDGLEFDFDQLRPAVTLVKRLGDYLDPNIRADDPRYRAVEYLKEKMVRDAGKGNSFTMQYMTEDSVSVPTLRKGYLKGGSTDPRLMNPLNPELSRLLTGEEHARIKGVPLSLIEGLSDSVAHQLLGQGILYDPFQAVGRRMGECLAKVVGTKAKLSRAKSHDSGPSFGIG